MGVTFPSREVLPADLQGIGDAADARGWLLELVDRCVDVADRLGISDRPELRGELFALLEEPTRMYAAHPNWPSAMSVVGPPIEISLRLDPRESPALRFVADITDHEQDLGGNWARYVASTAAVVGGGEEADALARRLCRTHLDAVPSQYRSRVLHGIGFGSEPVRRGTVYFRNRVTLDGAQVHTVMAPQLEQLVVAARSAGCRASELVGYDFRDGDLAQVKLFCPIDRELTHSLLERIVPSDVSLGAARAIADAFWDRSRVMKLFCALQFSTAGASPAKKLYFSCPAWGWHHAAGLFDLVRFLTSELGVDLEPLGALMETLPSQALRLSPGFVAVSGPAGQPGLSFYFSPTMRRREPASRGPKAVMRRRSGGRWPGVVDRVIGSGLTYLAEAQGEEGQWSDFDPDSALGADGGHVERGSSDQLVTAFVAASLQGVAGAESIVGRAAEALQRWGSAGRGYGWNERSAPDAEATALALCVLWSTGRSVGPPPEILGGPLPLEDAESVSALLLASIAGSRSSSPRDVPRPTEELVRRIVQLQNPDGRWSSTRWASSLVATTRAANALAAASDKSGIGSKALAGAAQALMAWPLRADPFLMGLWLQGWRTVGGEPGNHTVQRIVDRLVSAQLADGTWDSEPCRRIPAPQCATASLRGWTGAYEPVCLDHGTVTCATVVAGLQAVLV